MTTDQSDQTGFKEGIYLETKKSSIGTGSTAKKTEYRNFWATGRLTADSAVMVLLDDKFNPTGLQETFSLETMTGANWFFVAEGEKKYHLLRPVLDRLLASPQAQPAAGPAPAAAPAGPAKWWEGSSPSGGPPANPFELKKDPKKSDAPKKGGWWDK